MELMVDPRPNLGQHAAERFPYSRELESYMHMANNETTSIDGTALVSMVFLDVNC